MLTNRQILILQVTVDDFIQSAQPVGSRQLSKNKMLSYSPATIRNDMADLEELGFLEKPHTSSGRIPSEKGYRYYVDHLLKPENIRQEDLFTIKSIFMEKMTETEELIKRSATILSELTNYTAILLGPDVGKHKVKRFSVVPINSDSAVAIIVTDSGHVENKLFSIPGKILPSDLEKMVNILNEKLAGTYLHDLHQKLESETVHLFKQHINRYGELFSSFREAVWFEHEDKLFYGGKMNMFNQPEFHNVQKIKEFMGLLDESEAIASIFQAQNKGIEIKIGTENKLDAMEDCSVITASYRMGDLQTGSIAIVGPKRMDYRRVVSIVDLLSGSLSHELTRILTDRH